MIRLGIAGAAHPNVGAFLAEAAARNDVNLAGVWDADLAISGSLAIQAGCPEYQSLQAILDAELDAIAIAAVYGDRADLACAFLQRGVHVAVD